MADFYSGLVDHLGRPIKKSELLTEQAAPTVAGVRQPFGDHPAAGLTPQRLARILRESIEGDPMRYLELAEDMEERHEHYQSVLSTRKLQVSGLEITVEAAGDEPELVKHADLVREVIGRDEFQDELFDVLDALGKGFSATEIIWDTSERQWMPARLEYRHPTWFTFDRADFDTLLLRGDNGEEPLKPVSWIIHKGKAKSGLTIRGGLARLAAWSFFFKSFTAKDWAIFCEAYGQPLRLGKYGPGASADDRDTLLQAVSNIGTDFAAIVPDGMAIEFVKAEISGTHELYEKRSEYLDRQVSKLVLGQVGTTDAVAGGFSGNKVHNEVRADIEKDDARKLGVTVTRDLAIPLVMLNFGEQKRYPRVKIGRPDEVDVEKLVTNVTKLVPMGLKVGMAAMRDKIGAPAPADDDELLVPRQQRPAEDRQSAPEPERRSQAAARPFASGDAIEQSVDDMLGDWEPLVQPLVAGLEGEIAGAQTEAEVKAILSRRAVTMDAGELAEALARSVFAARLAGEADQDLD